MEEVRDRSEVNGEIVFKSAKKCGRLNSCSGERSSPSIKDSRDASHIASARERSACQSFPACSPNCSEIAATVPL